MEEQIQQLSQQLQKLTLEISSYHQKLSTNVVELEGQLQTQKTRMDRWEGNQVSMSPGVRQNTLVGGGRGERPV